jgi:hypothetical protein
MPLADASAVGVGSSVVLAGGVDVSGQVHGDVYTATLP